MVTTKTTMVTSFMLVVTMWTLIVAHELLVVDAACGGAHNLYGGVGIGESSQEWDTCSGKADAPCCVENTGMRGEGRHHSLESAHYQ